VLQAPAAGSIAPPLRLTPQTDPCQHPFMPVQGHIDPSSLSASRVDGWTRFGRFAGRARGVDGLSRSQWPRRTSNAATFSPALPLPSTTLPGPASDESRGHEPLDSLGGDSPNRQPETVHASQIRAPDGVQTREGPSPKQADEPGRSHRLQIHEAARANPPSSGRGSSGGETSSPAWGSPGNLRSSKERPDFGDHRPPGDRSRSRRSFGGRGA
jgi:hypothetical protein